MKNYLSFLLIAFCMLADAQPDITEINTQMVFIKAGNFEMGNNNEKQMLDHCTPLHLMIFT
jgi:formylglycine-generating enzyme required for sulfatase activity